MRRYRPFAQVRAVGGPYVDQVVSEFHALPPEAAALPRYEEARRVADNKAHIDWQQLFTLELWVLQMMPLPQLEARAASLIQWSVPTTSECPKPSHADYEAALRGWAVNRLTECQWAFRKSLLREQESWRLRRRMNETLLVVSVLAVIFGTAAALLGWNGLALVAGVAWLGVAGGYASVSRRVQMAGLKRPAAPHEGMALGDLCALDVGQDSIVQGMLLGGLFAVIGMFILASGLIDTVFSPALIGALLPHFGGPADMAEQGYLGWLAPTVSKDVARLAVWSFLFGFTERLIPDVLDRFSGRFMQATKDKPDTRRKSS
ncbi:MAG: hypothetical protein JO218_19710 [Burkholderiales bacterium]|nr:hypothetical protein [Burkholderiales bacterium]